MYKYKTGIIAIIAFVSVAQSAVKEKMTIPSLMGKYAAAQEKLRPFILKSEAVSEYENSFTSDKLKNLAGHKIKVELDELRYDGNRLKHIKQYWKDVPDPNELPNDSAFYLSCLWDGEQTLNNTYSEAAEKPDTVIIIKGKNETTTVLPRGPFGPMMGFFYGDDRRIDLIIGKSTHRIVRPEKEKIGDSWCYVIEALTRSAAYTIWIDPEHDYHIARAVVSKEPGGLFYNRVLSPDEYVSVSIENVRFEKIDNIWVPVDLDVFFDVKYSKLDSWTLKQHYKVLQMMIKPDFEKLKAFSTDDVRNGANVYIPNSEGKIREHANWKDGKIVRK